MVVKAEINSSSDAVADKSGYSSISSTILAHPVQNTHRLLLMTQKSIVDENSGSSLMVGWYSLAVPATKLELLYLRPSRLQLYTSFNLLSIDKLHILQILFWYLNACTVVIWFDQYILTILYWIMRSIITMLDWVRAYIFVVQVSFGQKCIQFKAAHFGIDCHHHWKSPLLLLY